MKTLKPEYDKLAADYVREYGTGNCSCHISAPCGSCTHEGNPNNLEETPEAWEEAKTPQTDKIWLIRSNEHNAWWRPNSCGYTTHVEAAGRYSKSEADANCRSRSPQRFKDDPPPEVAVIAPEFSDMLAAAVEDKKYGWQTAREATNTYEKEHKEVLALREHNAILRKVLEDAATHAETLDWSDHNSVFNYASHRKSDAVFALAATPSGPKLVNREVLQKALDCIREEVNPENYTDDILRAFLWDYDEMATMLQAELDRTKEGQ